MCAWELVFLGRENTRTEDRSVFKMGVLDKFLDIMKLNDDEYEDEFFDEDEVEEYEEKPKKSFFKKEKEDKGREKEEEDEFGTSSKVSKSAGGSGNKVTPMRQPAKRATGMEVRVMKPANMEDAKDITETLLSNRTVILNLEGMDLEVAQRIIDFTCGATYAIDGHLQKISSYIFLVTPTNVDISGDLQDLLNTSFDVPSIKNRY